MITFVSFLASYSNSFYLETFLDKGSSSLNVFMWDITNIFLIKVSEGRVRARAEEKVEGQYLVSHDPLLCGQHLVFIKIFLKFPT